MLYLIGTIWYMGLMFTWGMMNNIDDIKVRYSVGQYLAAILAWPAMLAHTLSYQ